MSTQSSTPIKTQRVFARQLLERLWRLKPDRPPFANHRIGHAAPKCTAGAARHRQQSSTWTVSRAAVSGFVTHGPLGCPSSPNSSFPNSSFAPVPTICCPTWRLPNAWCSCRVFVNMPRNAPQIDGTQRRRALVPPLTVMGSSSRLILFTPFMTLLGRSLCVVGSMVPSSSKDGSSLIRIICCGQTFYLLPFFGV